MILELLEKLLEGIGNFIKYFENANWCDDIISAVISTVLALVISWSFYNKSNRDAFFVTYFIQLRNVN